MIQKSKEDIVFELVGKFNRKYRWANISAFDTKTILEQVKNDIKLESGPITLPSLEKNIEGKYISIISSRLMEDEGLDLLCNYIKLNLKKSDNLGVTLGKYKKFINMLSTFGYFLTDDKSLELLKKSSKLRDVIGVIYRTNSLSRIETLGNDINNFSLFEAYNTMFDDCYGDMTPDEYSDFSDNVSIYFDDINNYELMTDEELSELEKRVSQGDKTAREELIIRNLKFVVSIAKKYQNHGLDLLDLIQEGNMGLMSAVNKYDCTKGNFYPYAAVAITYNIHRAIREKGSCIKVTREDQKKVFELVKTINELTDRLKRIPHASDLIKKTGLSYEELSRLESLRLGPMSFDYLLNDEDAESKYPISCLDDTLESNYEITNLSEEVDKLFIKAKLKDSEKDVLDKYFGLHDNPRVNTTQIAKELKVSRQRVDQIMSVAIKKIRLCSDTANLAVYAQEPLTAKKYLEKYRTSYWTSKKMQASFEEKKMYGLKSIYEIFSDESKEVVDFAVSKLSESDMELFRLRFIEGVQPSKMPAKFKTRMFNILNNRIIKNILSIDMNLKTIYEYFDDYPKGLVDRAVSLLDDKSREVFMIRFGEDLDKPMHNKDVPLEIRNALHINVINKIAVILSSVTNTKNDLLKLNDSPDAIDNIYYKALSQAQRLNKEEFQNLTDKEKYIIMLKFGYIDNMCFTNSAICKYLSTSSFKVKTTVNKLFYDQGIKKDENKPKTLKLRIE